MEEHHIFIQEASNMKTKPISEIKVNLGINPNGRVQRFLTDTCYKHMDKYVPMKDNLLRTVVDIRENTITYEMPQAHYQYVGMREDGSHKIKHYTTPGTGPYWDRRMVSAEINDVVQEVQDFINGKNK